MTAVTLSPRSNGWSEGEQLAARRLAGSEPAWAANVQAPASTVTAHTPAK
jgi:hypothetical protein